MRTRLRMAAAASFHTLGFLLPLAVAVVVGLVLLDRPVTTPGDDLVGQGVAIVAAVTALAATDSFTTPALDFLRHRVMGRRQVPCSACGTPHAVVVDDGQEQEDDR